MLVPKLAELGLSVRTAARRSADVRFDWSDPTTYRPALEGADRVYLMTPVLGQERASTDLVGNFLDQAAAARVQHVTYLSAYGMDQAPPEVGPRAVELDLLSRNDFTHSIVRPAWFMQNFSEGHLVPVDGLITVPTGEGTEAFVDVEDIAAVAAVTLADPGAHAGAQYPPTGPEVMTVSDAAPYDVIATITGEPIKHCWMFVSPSLDRCEHRCRCARRLRCHARLADRDHRVWLRPPVRPMTSSKQPACRLPPSILLRSGHRESVGWARISDRTVQGCLPSTILRRCRVIENMVDFRALDPFFRISSKAFGIR